MQDFALSVVLFIFFFCFYAWLITPSEASRKKFNPSSDMLQNTDVVQVNRGNDTRTIESIDPNDLLSEKIKILNLVQIRKLASKLREKGILSSGTKLSGRGIGKEFLCGIVSDRISTNYAVILEVANQVLNEV